MATFKAIVQNKRADGTYNVRIQITHNSKVKRLSTPIYITSADLTKSLKIKNVQVQNVCDDIIIKCRDFCMGLGFAINTMSLDGLVDKLKTHLEGGERFRLDFIEYTLKLTEQMTPGTAGLYKTTIGAIRRFIMRDSDLDISEINATFLKNFVNYIETEPSQRGDNRKTKQTELTDKGGRAASLYLTCIRAAHNKAKAEYNDEDRGLIRIPFSPFKNFKIKAAPKTKKRALSVDVIQAIIDIPYKEEKVGGKWSRFNLAKDCFIISFVLVGINSVDMYYADISKDDVLGYNRKKIESRREDGAEMRVRLEGAIDVIIEKYKDDKRLFSFYRHYTDPHGFNKAINKGLKQIGEIIGVEGLNFYAARHSWATIARSAAVGIDKATVHEALNHADKNMKVTDIYIERDWSTIWNANEKVLALFDWSAIGYDLL